MFREAAMTAVAVTGVGILLHALIARRPGRKAAVERPRMGLFVGLVRAAAALVVFVCMLGLGISGLYARLVLDAAVSGYWLIVHVAFGGAFVASMAVFAVAWAWDHRDPPHLWGREVAFWLMVIAAIPMVLAVLLNMFPVFGTPWQGLLLNVHRYSALVCAICGVVWGYLTIRRVKA